MKYSSENSAAPAGGAGMRARAVALVLASIAPCPVWAQTLFGRHDAQPVVISGVVPDEATKSQLLGKVREVYGERVVDQLSIGRVVTPPNWSSKVQKILNAQLHQVKKGQLHVDGNVVRIRGVVANEAARQQFVSQLATSLTSSYSVKDGLTVQSADQSNLDRALGNRIVEFDSGSANLTESGKLILNEIAAEIGKLGGRRVEIVGHTDNEGSASNNLILSRARAEAVRQFLARTGIPPTQLTTLGMGASQPVASNDEADGRRKNRRIEFRIMRQ